MLIFPGKTLQVVIVVLADLGFLMNLLIQTTRWSHEKFGHDGQYGMHIDNVLRSSIGLRTRNWRKVQFVI